MKLKEVQKKLSSHGITVKKTGYGNEHRVAHKGKNSEPSAYYTDDLEDAHGAGMKMYEQHRAAREAEARAGIGEGKPYGVNS